MNYVAHCAQYGFVREAITYTALATDAKDIHRASGVGAAASAHCRRVDAVVLRLRHLFEQHLQRVATGRIGRRLRVGYIRRGDVFAGAGIAIRRSLNHSLGQQTIKGFSHIDQAPILQRLGEKAGIQQMQNGVLNATDVLLHRQPAVHGFAAERLCGVVWVGETEEIPGRTNEGVHRVGFALELLAGLGICDLHPLRGPRQRRRG